MSAFWEFPRRPQIKPDLLSASTALNDKSSSGSGHNVSPLFCF